MRSWAKRTAKTVVFVTGFAAAGGGLTGVALAGTGTSSSGSVSTGNISAASGNQVIVPISIPVNVCGNASAVLGFATAGCRGGASVSGASSQVQAAATGGKDNITVGGPNVVVIPVQAAVNACGNAVGHATAHCQGGVSLPGGGAILPAGSGDHAGPNTHNIAIASGNTVHIPVTVPVNICGNAVAVLGDSTAGCAGGASVSIEQQRAAHQAKPAARQHKAKAVKARKAKAHEASKAGAHPLKPVQAARLGTLPAVSGVLGLVQPLVQEAPLISTVTSTVTHVTTLPATRLAAVQASVAGQPMSDASLVALAVGALLTGAAALKVAGRSFRARGAARTAAGGTGREEAAA